MRDKIIITYVGEVWSVQLIYMVVASKKILFGVWNALQIEIIFENIFLLLLQLFRFG